MRVLGIDYGDARVGVSVSDPLGITAQGLKTIKNTGIRKLLEELNNIIKNYNPDIIVIGMPKNMDGSLGDRADKTMEFKERLKGIYSGSIEFWDERLTTVSAVKTLNQTNTRGKKRKESVDTIAAMLILQGYLDNISNKKI